LTKFIPGNSTVKLQASRDNLFPRGRVLQVNSSNLINHPVLVTELQCESLSSVEKKAYI